MTINVNDYECLSHINLKYEFKKFQNNPQMYEELFPDMASIQGSSTPYFCEAVQEYLEQLGPFRYDDEQSE